MAARLQGDVERGVAGQIAGLGQGVDLGVGLAVALMPALADDRTVAHDLRSDQRVRLDRSRPRSASSSARRIQRSSASEVPCIAQTS